MIFFKYLTLATGPCTTLLYGKILKLLGDLIQILQDVYDKESTDKPSVVLLDSGSDSNVGIKSSVQIATSLFQIFKEVWDWVKIIKVWFEPLIGG